MSDHHCQPGLFPPYIWYLLMLKRFGEGQRPWLIMNFLDDMNYCWPEKKKAPLLFVASWISTLIKYSNFQADPPSKQYLREDVTFNQSIPDHKYNLFRCSLFTYTMCIVCIVVVYKITILYCFKYIIQDTCIIQYLQLCNATALFRKRVKNVPVQM